MDEISKNYKWNQKNLCNDGCEYDYPYKYYGQWKYDRIYGKFEIFKLKDLIRILGKELAIKVVSDIEKYRDEYTLITDVKAKEMFQFFKDNMVTDLDKYTELDWIVQNPGTQINGSYNPIVSEPEDWYTYIEYIRHTTKYVSYFDKNKYSYYLKLMKAINETDKYNDKVVEACVIPLGIDGK